MCFDIGRSIDKYANRENGILESKNENIEENWTAADISNNDDWYAYKDNTGKKLK